MILGCTAQNKTFKDDLIVEIGPGSIIGERSLVDEQPRSATMRSIQFTDVAIIPAERLHALLPDDPYLSFGSYKNIA